MSNTSLLGSFGGQGDSSLMFRNHLINGCFRVWQRGTSQTANGYGSDDRWTNINVGSTKTHSRQSFTLGQTDVPGNPQYFSRTVVNSVAGAGSIVAKIQRIEGVQTLAGQTAVFSFWAKADAPKNMVIEFAQVFGTGGSPSALVGGIGITTIALTTSWKYYTVVVNIPGISGKTIGTDGNDWLECVFWFDAGSNYNARTNSLGQQSGTFDIANAMLEAGPTATPFERRPIGTELQLCQRYFEKSYNLDVVPGTDTSIGVLTRLGVQYSNVLVYAGGIQYKVQKRANPSSITFYTYNGTINKWHYGVIGFSEALGNVATIDVSQNGFTAVVTTPSVSGQNAAYGQWTANAEL